MHNALHIQTTEWKHFSERDSLQQEYICVSVYVDKNLYTFSFGNI